MNQESNQDRAGANPSTVGDVLSNMIQQLNTSNSNIVGQIREIGSATTSNLDRIGQALTPSGSAVTSGLTGKDLLNAINPISNSKGTNILTSLFLGPVWKGLFSLFGGGGGEQETVPLTKFNFPEQARTDLAASLRADGLSSSVRTDAFGLSQSAPVSQPSIQISIQALDARSILDRSDDIAAALKQAMLSNHEINDNLNEI
jgi:hypothetical protein